MDRVSLAEVTMWAVASSHEDRLLSKLIGADIGALLVVLAFARRVRLARRHDPRLEQHAQWRAAPFSYAAVWLLVIGFAVALSRGSRSTVAWGLFAGFTALWIVAGILLRADRQLETSPAPGHETADA